MLFEFAFKSSKLFVHSISLVIASATFLCAAPVVAQPVTLADEKVIAPLHVDDDADDHYLLDLDLGLCRLSPDGRTLLTIDAADRAATQSPAKLVILRLESLAEGGKRVELRPDLGKTSVRDAQFALRIGQFSPDGKHLLLPLENPLDGPMRVPILHCETETGRVRKMQITTDLRYARVDGTSRILLDMDGRAFSVVTGKPVKPFKFGGHVDDANPVAPLVFTNTGVEGRPQPWRVHVWNLRDDRLLATLPHNP